MSMTDVDPRIRTAAQRLHAQLSARGVDRGVVAAMVRVPRHEFVPADVQASAYEDVPLPIGLEQTISQPSLVGKMTEALRLNRMCRVLEIGTGCGYQTAILAELASQVYSVELEETLSIDARVRLRRLGYRNVEACVGDGYQGWPERAPFDAIIVTASAPHVPPPLVAQLKPNGRMILPVAKELVLVIKDAEGQTSEKGLGSVAFVPLRRR